MEILVLFFQRLFCVIILINAGICRIYNHLCECFI